MFDLEAIGALIAVELVYVASTAGIARLVLSPLLRTARRR